MLYSYSNELKIILNKVYIMDDVDVKRKVIHNLNKQFGNNFKNLGKCVELQQKYQNRVTEIENSLSFSNDNPSRVISTIQNVDRMIDKIETHVGKYNELSENICNHLEETDIVRKTIGDYVDQIDTLEHTLVYFTTIQEIDDLSAELQQAMSAKNDEECSTAFANLCDVSRSLLESPATNLRSYLKETLHYWHNLLKDKYSAEFDEVLKAIKWPFTSTTFSLQAPSPQNIVKLQHLSEHLLQIQLPEESAAPIVTSALLSDFPPLSLPIAFMVRPLRKRFIYHFYGARQTNRIDKPEWYFTQILSWIRDHHSFVVKYIQPTVDKLGYLSIDVKVELMRGLVQLAVEKLYSDLPTLQFDDFTFSHCVDEALGFDRELKESYEYPSSQPSVLAVLTQAQVFIKWLLMEKKYATEKIDAVLAAEDAFAPLASDMDELKITVCADMFITLLQTIMERYEALPQPGHRLQFLDFQLDLLDDFRVRLLQLIHVETDEPVESRLPQIANTVNYIENVLLDWGTTVHYLHLYHYKTQFEAVSTDKVQYNKGEDSSDSDYDFNFGTVFDKTLSLFKHMRTDLVFTLCDAVVHDVAARSRPYRKDRWADIQLQKDVRSLSLSPRACPLFEILATRLHQLQKQLATQLFRNVWHCLAERLDTFFYEELILENRYNEGGAMQLKFDMTRNLFPLFAQYTDRPESYFNKIHESCILLNLAKGSALLLRETIVSLEGATGVEDRRGMALAEVGVTLFTPKEAVDILNLRNDITSFNDLLSGL